MIKCGIKESVEQGASNSAELTDDNGVVVREGDWVTFTSGLTLLRVVGQVVQGGQSLILIVGGHKPSRIYLNGLRDRVGAWYKCSSPKSV